METKNTFFPETFSASSVQGEILFLLAYFDIFKHPLKEEDFFRLKKIEPGVFRSQMEVLLKQGVCFGYMGYYALSEEIGEWTVHRQQAEARAQNYWKHVRKNAQRIAKFPFVRGVAISGSLSKGVMTPDGDIDFFVITEPNRLWLCRTMLILYKKIRLLNSRKYFCLNYFVDTQNLTILDKNVFTAVEVAHLIPVYDQEEVFEKFYQQNTWVDAYVHSPATIIQQAQPLAPFYWEAFPMKTGIKWSLENLFRGSLGSTIEKWAHEKTMKRWMKKFKHFDETKFELTMRSTKGVSKHHPHDYQNRVLTTFSENLENALRKVNAL